MSGVRAVDFVCLRISCLLAFTQTRLMPAFRVSTGLHVKHRRPSAGDASHEGLLKVERREFRCLEFRF